VRTIINGEVFDLSAEEREPLTNGPSRSPEELRREAMRGRHQAYSYHKVVVVNGVEKVMEISLQEWLQLNENK